MAAVIKMIFHKEVESKILKPCVFYGWQNTSLLYLYCVDIQGIFFSLKGEQFRRKEIPTEVEEDNHEESKEKEVSSCDEDNLSTRSNSTATPFAGGKEVVAGILIYQVHKWRTQT